MVNKSIALFKILQKQNLVLDNLVKTGKIVNLGWQILASACFTFRRSKKLRFDSLVQKFKAPRGNGKG